MKLLRSIRSYVFLVLIVFVAASTDIGAQRRAGGGAARAGGGAGRVNFGATQSSIRSTQSVNRSVNANRDIDRNVNVANVDRDVNINRDIDVNANYDRWGHPIARGVTAGVAIGTAVAMLPSGCSTVVVDGIGYSQCGSTWYQPVYSGTSVQYVAVSAP